MRDAVETNLGAVAINLIRRLGAVGDTSRETHIVILRLCLNGGDDAVHGIDAVEIIGRHDHRAVGMLQGCRKATADHIAQHIEDHHIGIFQQMMLLEQLDRLAHDITATAGAGGRATGLDAHDAIIAHGHEILGAEFFGVEIHIFQNIDHRRLQMARQRECAVMLWVTADLEHFLAQLGERRRQVGGGRRFADPAFAVNRENLRALDLHRRVEMHLKRSLAIFALA